MRSSAWIWRLTASVSVAATVVLILGFMYAYDDINDPQGQPLLPGAESEMVEDIEEGPTGAEDSQSAAALPTDIKVTVIGDSLARGTGDKTGSGFVRRSIDQLHGKEGHTAKLLANLAINGLTTEGLLPKLEEKGLQYALQEANVIMLSIGGNDLFQGSGLMEGIMDEEGSELDPAKLMGALPQASERLQLILEKLRTINPNARIIYIGLYHPFADLEDLLIPGNIVVTAWNYAVMEIVSRDPNMTLVPTFDLFQHKLGEYLSSDHFHPNGDGYQAIADRIVEGML
ncbi:SGNH/GDSL hydrolase family protein [Paenibacillus sp. JCM 10914]|uniref:GDSL-type esterase/lipase family protein n=1 Tax=Paenibacillus sp. JCM 10914 TaxID=1236974 RepID=UPI0003CC708A|nr:GDSL-type esterase/lipase family protein [Paenibacillus sp. JCM 10914]GAE05239.1 lipase/Acylhydrolase with GDSL-like motif [Paenibacillus sp. JCM 10914]